MTNWILMLAVWWLPAAASFAQGEGVTLFFDDFDYPDGKLPAGYWAEGSTQAGIRDGRLVMDANPATNPDALAVGTVWLDREFSGDLQVEFDVCVIGSAGDKNNINLMFLYADPGGRPLRESRDARVDGAYRRYHELNGYIVTFLADGQVEPARFRLRDNPGFNLLAERFTYHCRAGHVYRVVIRKRGARLQYEVDGRMILDEVDDRFNAPHARGYLGFRTFRTVLWWDNFRVTRLAPEA